MDKKLLVSDYDGTILTTKNDLKLNLRFINKFMNNGNIFCLSTGRPFDSIYEEIQKYNIEFDYLTCCNGRVLLDNQYNILFKKLFTEEETLKLNNKK